MLDVEINDKLIKITDDNLTRVKINSIKIIVDKYGIKDILDFKLTFIQKFYSFAESNADVILSKSISIEELYNLLVELFDTIDEEDLDGEEDMNISFEGLFIL